MKFLWEKIKEGLNYFFSLKPIDKLILLLITIIIFMSYPFAKMIKQYYLERDQLIVELRKQKDRERMLVDSVAKDYDNYYLRLIDKKDSVILNYQTNVFMQLFKKQEEEKAKH